MYPLSGAGALSRGLLRPFGFRAAAWYWAPLIIWMAAIFALSSISSATIETARPAQAARSVPAVANQVSVHLGEFGLLAVLVYRVAGRRRRAADPYLVALVLTLTALYGASDELHQSVVPGRHPSWLDLGYDTLGAAGGVAVAVAWSWARTRIGGPAGGGVGPGA